MSTMLHQNVVFDNHPVYLSGASFKDCTFRNCTLIIKNLDTVGGFENCEFDRCVWYLEAMVSDRDAWERFQQQIAPSIQLTLPHPAPDA